MARSEEELKLLLNSDVSESEEQSETESTGFSPKSTTASETNSNESNLESEETQVEEELEEEERPNASIKYRFFINLTYRRKNSTTSRRVRRIKRRQSKKRSQLRRTGTRYPKRK